MPGLWLTGTLAFLPMLGNRFIGDDYTALAIFRAYRSRPFFETILYGGNDFFRPLNMALIMARGAAFGDNPLPYVIANVTLHLINTTLVFLIARRIFKNLLASASFLFLAAFSHYEGITWISSSVTLFVTFFVLISIYGHVKFREESKIGWLILGVAGFIAAFLTKETTVALPFILLIYDLILVKTGKRSKAFFYPYAIYGVLLAVHLVTQTGWALRFMGTNSIYKAGWHVLTNLADYWVWLWIPNPRHPYVAGVLLIEREFVRISTTTERLALEIGELVELEDEDVIFIEGLPSHVHLREVIQWYHNPTVHVHADNDKYRDTPKTLEETRRFYSGKQMTLYFLRFEEGGLLKASSEPLSGHRR